MTTTMRRIPSSWIYTCLLATLPLYGVQSARGAILASSRDPQCQYELRGPIEAFDHKKVEAIPGLEAGAQIVICLNSPGGSYVGGKELYNTFMVQGIGTRVRRGDQCHSACALAFLGGSIWGDHRYVNRSMEPGAKLGFHAPYVNLPKGTYDDKVVANTTRAAIRIVNLLVKDRSSLKVSEKFIADFVLYDARETKAIATIRDAAHAGVELSTKTQDISFTRDALKNACVLLFDRYIDAFEEPIKAHVPVFDPQEDSEFVEVREQVLTIDGAEWRAISAVHAWELPYHTASCAFRKNDGIPGGYQAMMWSNDINEAPDLTGAIRAVRIDVPWWFFLPKETPVSSL